MAWQGILFLLERKRCSHFLLYRLHQFVKNRGTRAEYALPLRREVVGNVRRPKGKLPAKRASAC